jgi:serine/threonine-protein kinase
MGEHAPGGDTGPIGTDPAASGERLRSVSLGSSDETPTLLQPARDDDAAPTVTPELALQKDEVERSRLFLKLSAYLAGAVGLTVPFLAGSVVMRATVVACCAIAVVVMLLFRRTLHGEVLSTTRRWVIVSSILVAASIVAVLFFGAYSPAPMVGTFGIYFLCLGSSTKIARWAYAGGAIGHLIPAMLIAFGVVHDPGILAPASDSMRNMLVAAVMVQIVFGTTYLLARGSRNATRDAVEKLHAALVQVQKREALLAEANLQLDRALLAGHRGPYTDARMGEWRLSDVIGRGAMGDVYAARREGDSATGESDAAVKVLHRVLALDPTHVKRFLREAQIVASMKSPHVVRFFGLGNFDSTSDASPPYIAMELLHGNDLAWHLRREGKLAPARLLELVQHVADVLAEAATANIVHRDLKPQNIFLARPLGGGAAIWKVLDFGVSKLASDRGSLTQGAPIGTPGYMAPEQARGDRVDPRADVFSLACIAYRVLTGRPAFSGDALPQVLFDVCFAQPARPSELVAVTTDVERVLAIGLAKSPDDRFASARELSASLGAALAARLPASLRTRADALIAAMPWGSRLR